MGGEQERRSSRLERWFDGEETYVVDYILHKIEFICGEISSDGREGRAETAPTSASENPRPVDSSRSKNANFIDFTVCKGS